MEVSKTLIPIGEEIGITLTLTNIGDTDVKITYGPPLFDAGYCTPDGCFYWSDGKVFISVILDLILEPGENITQTLEWDLYQYEYEGHDPPRPGTYNLTGICIYAGTWDTVEVTLFLWNPADINYDWKVDIFDIVIAAGAYETTSSDPNWNPLCDIAEPYGIIDMFDIVTITGNYGEYYS